MAVKKTEKQKAVEVEVDVQEIPVVEEQVEDTENLGAEETEVAVEDIPVVEVEEPKEPEVTVEVEKANVDTSNKPNGNVKIRMRVDHKCCIAMERYDLKEGKTYVVPENVKRILNKAGLLAPL